MAVNDDRPELGGGAEALKAAMRYAGAQAWYGLRLLGRSGRALPKLAPALLIVLALFAWNTRAPYWAVPALPGTNRIERTAPDFHSLRLFLRSPVAWAVTLVLDEAASPLPFPRMVWTLLLFARAPSPVEMQRPSDFFKMLPAAGVEVLVGALVFALLLVLLADRLSGGGPKGRIRQRFRAILPPVLALTALLSALFLLISYLSVYVWQGRGTHLWWLLSAAKILLLPAPYLIAARGLGLWRAIAQGLGILRRRIVAVLVVLLLAGVMLVAEREVGGAIARNLFWDARFPFAVQALWMVVLALLTCVRAITSVWVAGAWMLLAVDEGPAAEAGGA